MVQNLVSTSQPEASLSAPHHRRSRYLLELTAAALTIITIAVGISAMSCRAFSQSQQTGKFDVEGRKRSLLEHLNTVIQFYRSSTTLLQKVGEPNDIVYRDQAVSLATETTQLAFQSTKAEADLMDEYQRHQGIPAESSGPVEQQRLRSAAIEVDRALTDLKSRATALDQRIALAGAKDRVGLVMQRKQLQGALDLEGATKDALQKIIGMSEAQGVAGFGGQIQSLERSLPQLGSKTASVAAQLAPLDQARSSGVSSQTMALFNLLSAEHSIDNLIRSNDSLHKQAQALRAPLSDMARGLVMRGQQLTQQLMQASGMPPAGTSSGGTVSTAEPLESITGTFKAVSSASVPLSQEIIVLEQSQANLAAWRGAVDREYKSILAALLLRLMAIAIALAIIFAAGELWTRATNRYVREARRRRQLLLLRRTVVGFLLAIVLLFGFVTQFNSLATFAGFITAGIAVGLQTILLSVAAYFFIIGRYGIRIGDRITVPPVTGEVIEVGLVRFYVMELAGTGTELHPTGRVAVFSNAVLFQAGTPIYKQIPGTQYAWHELIVKLSETEDYKAASQQILSIVRSVYDEYRSEIESQHRAIEEWMHTTIAPPAVESRLQFVAGELQSWARFPVEIKRAEETDERLTSALLQLFERNLEIKKAVKSLPLLQPSVRG